MLCIDIYEIIIRATSAPKTHEKQHDIQPNDNLHVWNSYTFTIEGEYKASWGETPPDLTVALKEQADYDMIIFSSFLLYYNMHMKEGDASRYEKES